MVKLRAKCIVVGDPAVGKSTLCQMFCSEGSHFQKNYSMTAGVELLVKSMNIPESSDSVELFIFDSGGKETFVDAFEKLWGQASLLCLVYDVTSDTSFRNCGTWLERVRTLCQGLHIPGVLVGNKLDLSLRREVEAAEAQDWAHSQGLEYHETSAKELEHSDAPFVSLARAYYSMYRERLQAIHSMA